MEKKLIRQNPRFKQYISMDRIVRRRRRRRYEARRAGLRRRILPDRQNPIEDLSDIVFTLRFRLSKEAFLNLLHLVVVPLSHESDRIVNKFATLKCIKYCTYESLLALTPGSIQSFAEQ